MEGSPLAVSEIVTKIFPGIGEVGQAKRPRGVRRVATWFALAASLAVTVAACGATRGPTDLPEAASTSPATASSVSASSSGVVDSPAQTGDAQAGAAQADGSQSVDARSDGAGGAVGSGATAAAAGAGAPSGPGGVPGTSGSGGFSGSDDHSSHGSGPSIGPPRAPGAPQGSTPKPAGGGLGSPAGNNGSGPALASPVRVPLPTATISGQTFSEARVSLDGNIKAACGDGTPCVSIVEKADDNPENDLEDKCDVVSNAVGSVTVPGSDGREATVTAPRGGEIVLLVNIPCADRTSAPAAAANAAASSP
jgi:hypothetical protein